MKQLTNLVVAGVTGLLLVPAAALAQASIAGVVRDTSAAVLPGVTVEVTSPALIEKIRSASTDGTGQYRIENLRPGTYVVTFTLPGFATVKREGLELSGSLTATVNAEMSVGGVAETVTVSGESPIVDIQSAKRQEVLAGDIVKAIPTTRNYNALVVLVPGVTTDRNDVVTGPIITLFGIHGGPLSEGQLQVDGINIGNAPGLGAGGTSNYVADIGNAQEVTFTTSGGLGEVENGGAVMNIVPRTGGNSTSGSFYASGANDALQGSNYTEALKAAGLRAPDPLHQGLGRQRRRRRAFHARPAVVLRDGENPGKRTLRHEPVLQQERRQSQRVDLRARLEPASLLRPGRQDGDAAPDVASNAAQQVQRLLGRAGHLREVHRRVRGQPVTRSVDVAGGNRHWRYLSTTPSPGQLELAAEQQGPRRSQPRQHVFPVG